MNRLADEKSPYLQQHRTNPINWYPWGDEAFQTAIENDKPIFLSIGYSTCHWCHVMEGDSFVKQDVAEIINRDFIAIKVDREELPTVDAIYMSAVQAMTGRGGWPLSLFLTPDLKPFWGGTFIPKDQFTDILTKVSDGWNSGDRNTIINVGDTLISRLKYNSPRSNSFVSEITDAAQISFAKAKSEAFDSKYGGFSPAPKFPKPLDLMLLLRFYRRSNNEELLNIVTKTLDEMTRGGINDQLGGGFHRYSTDEKWLVPHFEKMLYDNALLILTYAEAFQTTKNRDYLHTLKSTADYLLRDMSADDGGFYSAEDADSEKTEGKFYVWRYDELTKILNDDELNKIVTLFNIEKEGNYIVDHAIEALEATAGLKAVKNANILTLDSNETMSYANDPIVASAIEKMQKARSQRVRPGLDDKILTGWNGLAIAALSKAYQITKEESYLNAAQKSANFIMNQLFIKGSLLRRYRDGQSKFAACLDDYSFLIFGLIELYQSDFDAKWLSFANNLQEIQIEKFWDDGLFTDSDGSDKSLLINTKTTYDGAEPSGNAVSCLNLQKLSDIMLNMEYKEIAKSQLSNMTNELGKSPTAYPMWLIALDYYTDASKEILITGDLSSDETKQFVEELRDAIFLPNKVILAKNTESISTDKELKIFRDKVVQGEGPTVYICEESTCQSPTNDIGEAVGIAKRPKKHM